MPTSTRAVSQSKAENAAALRWRGLLYNQVPLAGEWMRTRALTALTEMLQAGSAAAAAVLAAACDAHPEEAIRAAAIERLRAMRNAAGWDAAWQMWARERGAALGKLLSKHARPAAKPAAVRVLSLLFLQDEETLSEAGAELAEALIGARDDRDTLIAARARFALTRLKAAEAISALCARWIEKRDEGLAGTILQAGYLPERPPEARVLVALLANRLEVVTQCEPEHIPPLIDACKDGDEEIRARARFCLLNLQNSAAISLLCATWARERDGLLEEAIVRARYVASRPAAVRVLSALKTRRQDVATGVSAASLGFLLAAADDADGEIGQQARLALRGLSKEETRDALCRLVIEEDNEAARTICLEAGYLPSRAEQRALFLFLTGQISAYETLDFDQGMLNAVYSAAPAALRQRILRAVQQAGRTDFLTILTGADVRTRAAGLTQIESQLLVRVLAGNQEWERLWRLAQEISLPASVEIIRLLTSNGWTPADAGEHELFDGLAGLAARPMLTNGAELAAALPAAIPRARLKLNGRINDLAFSPAGPVLAIGSGARTLACWDFQKGELNGMVRGFDHSVGQVTYTPGNTLLCAERTNGSEACGVFVIREEQATRIGQHLGSVTALEPAGEGRFLTCGRDQMAALWNLDSLRAETERALSYWARAACVAPDEESVVLLHTRLSRLSLPGMAPQPDLLLRAARDGRRQALDRVPVRSMTRAAAFAGPEALLTGQYNGQVVLFENHRQRPTARLMTRFADPVTGVRAMPGREMAVAGSAGGTARFMTLSDGLVSGQIQVPGRRLTSLHVSPDGAFLSTGTDDSALTLWDLRVMDIPSLFNRPVAGAHPDDVTLVNTLVEYDLPGQVRTALLFLQRLLQQRFRYDIHIGEAVSIQAGEFDVLID